VKIDMSENVGILKRYLIKGSRGNICCSSTFFFVDCNTTTTATNSWGQKLHVIQSEKQQSDRRCTKQVASWKSNFGSEFTEKFEGDSIDVLHVQPLGENFPPPHGWRKVGGY